MIATQLVMQSFGTSGLTDLSNCDAATALHYSQCNNYQKVGMLAAFTTCPFSCNGVPSLTPTEDSVALCTHAFATHYGM